MCNLKAIINFLWPSGASWIFSINGLGKLSDDTEPLSELMFTYDQLNTSEPGSI